MFQSSNIRLQNFFLRKTITIVILAFSLNLSFAEKHKETQKEHHDENSVMIEDSMARKVGIKTRIARPGRILSTLTAYGEIINDPDYTSHLSARFPGLVAITKVDIGDKVQAGDVVVEIESNTSLNNYPIKSPITGIVTARNAEVGEFVQDQILYTIESFQELWAELQIFPNQITSVKLDQQVLISANNQKINTKISHLIPNQQNQPFIYARVKINNENKKWAPGMFVKGDITIKKIKAGIVVDNLALQALNGKTVVFVKNGNMYEPHELTLGGRDQKNSEVLNGLKAGDQYVVENSYLIKADIEKSNASHDD